MGMRFLRNLSVLALLALCLVTAVSPRATVARQNVDWMSSDQASQLGLGFTVLVPTWIPAPFGGSPAVQASGGYYSLYWMNGGGSPTFLQITGEVGGALPAGSPADLNNQLFINASVQGHDAIHDVTSIYDNVWWIAGGVLYTVSSNNMTGTDSLSLANSLVALEPPAAVEPTAVPTEPPQPAPTVPPAAPEPPPADSGGTDDGGSDASPNEPAPAGPTGSIDNAGSIGSGEVGSLQVFPSDVGTLRTTDGYFIDSGQTFITGLTGGAVPWQAPTVDVETEVQFTLLDAQTGTVTATSSITVVPVAGEASVEATVTQASQVRDDGTGGSLVSLPTATPPMVQPPTSGGTNGAQMSDGTAGPQLPPGSDGTGGIRQIALP